MWSSKMLWLRTFLVSLAKLFIRTILGFSAFIRSWGELYLERALHYCRVFWESKVPPHVKDNIVGTIVKWKNGELPALFQKPDDETEFFPAALEIVEQPPSPAARTIAATIMLFFAFSLIWACLGSVDIIATAQGKIVPTGRTKVIQPLDAGVVRNILVQDGQIVKEGDVLIEIDTTITEAERDRLQKEYISEELNVARLKSAVNLAEDPQKSFVPPEGATISQVETQRNLLTNQMQEIKSKLEGLDHQIAQQQGNLAAVDATIKKLTESIPYLKERSQSRKYLSDKGYGSKLDYLTTKQDLVEHEQEIEVQKGKLAEASGSFGALQKQREQAEAEYQHKTLSDLESAQQKASSLHEQLVQATQKFRLQTLKAPVDGTVQQLSVHTEGGVVSPAQILMAIVPADSHMEVEARVSNKDIGFVHAGQEAAIKVDTFNFTRYGLLSGKVLSISQDAIVNDKPQNGARNDRAVGSDSESSEPRGQELIYLARVLLDQSYMVIDDRKVSLSPGMAVTVEIKTGSRHIISYLLSPIRKHVSQAMRER